MVQNKKNKSQADGQENSGKIWIYSDEVKDHFFNPRNFVTDPKGPKEFDGVGLVGSPACGDMMKIWIKVDKEKNKIIDMKWQTFGCASAIGSTSILSVMVTENGGIDLEKARQIKPQDIIDRLGGLPNKKIHCSVLGDKALRSAINDYYKKSGQIDKVIEESARMIDPEAKVTDKDIEEAVLEGATTLEEVQKKTKAGLGRPELVPEIEQLIKFYREKYFG